MTTTPTAPPGPTPTGAPVRRYVAHLMGMPISLALRGRHTDDLEAQDAWQQVLACLRDVDRVFSPYRHDSWVSRLDRGEGCLDEAPEEVHAVLSIGARAARESGGAFDVRRPRGDGTWRLDPSGVVKGWALDRAARPLRHLEATEWCLGGGGDLVVSSDPAGPGWRIGIEDPRDTSRVVAVQTVWRGGLATSGTAHRGAHLVDARTGRAAAGVLQVSVAAPDLTTADVDATTAYVLGAEGAAWLAGRPDRVALVVTLDGGTVTVRGPVTASGRS